MLVRNHGGGPFFTLFGIESQCLVRSLVIRVIWRRNLRIVVDLMSVSLFLSSQRAVSLTLIHCDWILCPRL